MVFTVIMVPILAKASSNFAEVNFHDVCYIVGCLLMKIGAVILFW